MFTRFKFKYEYSPIYPTPLVNCYKYIEITYYNTYKYIQLMQKKLVGCTIYYNIYQNGYHVWIVISITADSY